MTEATEASDAENPREPVQVRLDASDTDLDAPAAVASQIPHASTLAPGTRVLVLAAAKRDGGVLRRLLGGRRVPVPRSTLCTALLVQGYVDIEAGEAGAWGKAPSLS
jgi:hypothetical protein